MIARARESRRPAAAALAAALVLAWPEAAAAFGSPSGLGATLAAAGLRVDPAAQAAPDFELPLLEGGTSRLSDFGGSWIVLTFWAAWCGPCRSELPSLEAVHRQRSGDGIEVVGVALDRDPEASRALERELDLTFPSFHDADGGVASRYRAESIPVSYLIDPSGAVVAQARGARDWRQLLPALDAARAERPPGPAEAASFAAEASLALPAVTRPPTAELELSDADPRPGRPFDLLIRLRWAGDFAEYMPHPPELALPDGVVQEEVTAETSSRDGSHLVTYRLALRAERPGRYALDPLELRYTPAGAAEPVATRVAGPTVEVRRRGPGAVAGLATAVGGAAVLALAGLLAVRRRRASGERPPVAAWERRRELFSEARAARLRGDAEGFLTRIAELERELGEMSGAEAEELERRLEAARFGGRVPSRAVMDQLERRVERRLDSSRPDPRAAARGRLRLRRAGD